MERLRTIICLFTCTALLFCGCRGVQKHSEGGEHLLELDLAARSGDWNRILEIADPASTISAEAYYLNLAHAMTGRLTDSLMYRYQPFERGLFLPVDQNQDLFTIWAAGEVWFRLGEMTMAEHSAILSLAFSEGHKSEKDFVRLAQINLITGDDNAAAKYLTQLLEYPEHRRWALEYMPGRQSPEAKARLEEKRALLPLSKDRIHPGSDAVSALQALMEANPGNLTARDYLLCHHILTKNITAFAEAYQPVPNAPRVYQEAILIHLAASNQINPAKLSEYCIDPPVFEDFSRYTDIYIRTSGNSHALEKDFRYSYWFYNHFARINEK